MRCGLDGGAGAAIVIVKWASRRSERASASIRGRSRPNRRRWSSSRRSSFAAAPRLICRRPGRRLAGARGRRAATPLADLIRARRRRRARQTDSLRLRPRQRRPRRGHRRPRRPTPRSAPAYGALDPAVGRARGLRPALAGDAPTCLLALGLATRRPAVERESPRCVTALLEPGPFRAFTNGDAAANNFLTDGPRGKLIDFEVADFRHALARRVWIHIPGRPGSRSTSPRNAALEDAYPRRAGRGRPPGRDDRLFGHGMAAVCLAEACDRLRPLSVAGLARRRRPQPRADGRPPSKPPRPRRRHRACPALAGWQTRRRLAPPSLAGRRRRPLDRSAPTRRGQPVIERLGGGQVLHHVAEGLVDGDLLVGLAAGRAPSSTCPISPTTWSSPIRPSPSPSRTPRPAPAPPRGGRR